MIYYILVTLGDHVLDKYRFKNLGSEGHKRALKKAIESLESWLGPDIIEKEGVSGYLKLK